MTCKISFRDVQVTTDGHGVLITLTTDVPSTVTIRYSNNHPWTHAKPIERRGTRIVDDVRFCFTAFKDLLQRELGDTLIHTWLFPTWLYCQTKWFYFFGSISGEDCVSTSPYFDYHNTWQPPTITPVTIVKHYYPYAHMCMMNRNWLLLGFSNPTDTWGAIYQSLDSGFSWTKLVDSSNVGGTGFVPEFIRPVTRGYLLVVKSQSGGLTIRQIWWSPELPGSWLIVLGGSYTAGLWRGLPYIFNYYGFPHVWSTGYQWTTGHRPFIHISDDAGMTWGYGSESGMDQNPGTIWVSPDYKWGYEANVGDLSFQQILKSPEPLHSPATWDPVGVAPRSYRMHFDDYRIAWAGPQSMIWTPIGNTSYIEHSLDPAMYVSPGSSYLSCSALSNWDGQRSLFTPAGSGKGLWLARWPSWTWKKLILDLGDGINNRLNSVFVNPYSPLDCYAYGNLGFWRSGNGGESWYHSEKGLEDAGY